jgi:CBS-domain-containing membrane protein
MPHSMPVSKLMIPTREWPLLRAETQVRDTIKMLRIISEDEKLEHGHSTPLVLDDEMRLVGFLHLIDLLKSVRHLCDKSDAPCELGKATAAIKELVTPFAGTVNPDDSILTALDIMMEHRVSLVPVLQDGKLLGVVKLSDIFNRVAALLFDPEGPEEKESLMRRASWRL